MRRWVRVETCSNAASRSSLNGWVCAGLSAEVTGDAAWVEAGALTAHFRNGALHAWAVVVDSLGLVVHQASHRVIIATIIVTIGHEATGAVSATGAASRPFVMSRQGVTTSEFSATLGADMRSLASVELGVTLEIMESAESGITVLTNVRFFVAVCQKMTLQVVMAGEVGVAVWASVFLP